VRAAAAGPVQDDEDGWAADVDVLLAERARIGRPVSPALPQQLSVSTLVDLGRDPDGVAQRLARRLPSRPDPHAQLGTAFHDWVQRYYGADRLFDLDDLPGAVDADLAGGDAQRLARLREAFTASPWATRTPVEVEVPFEMAIGDTVVRGRIDAVFAESDGGATVVDWKTGRPPATPQELSQACVQLAVYRLAWAALQGCPAANVRAAFHYVAAGLTIRPDALPGREQLAALLVAPAT
jgi:DNA helicase II / ATP-dependent DNA helicase PcrA